MKNKALTIVVVIAALLVATFLYNKYRIAPRVKFEAVHLLDLDGKPVMVADNKTVIISFFATWCGPCLHEMPSMQEAQQKLGPNFHFVCVSDEPPALLKQFKERTGTTLTILHSPKSLKEYQVFTIPATYVLNTKAEIVFKQIGEIDWSDDAVLQMLHSFETK